MTDIAKNLRDFLFRALMVESEAGKFQSAGIQIGADTGHAEERLLSEELSAFGVNSRNNALQMARLYAVLHCFENAVRSFVRETLHEKEGHDWEEKLPAAMRNMAKSRQKTALKDSWLEGEKSDLLGFIEFGDLAKIILVKWAYFDNIIPSQQWLKQRMDELEKVRHFIAHNRMLLPSEFQRLYMYIRDWNRVVGL